MGTRNYFSIKKFNYLISISEPVLRSFRDCHSRIVQTEAARDQLPQGYITPALHPTFNVEQPPYINGLGPCKVPDAPESDPRCSLWSWVLSMGLRLLDGTFRVGL